MHNQLRIVKGIEGAPGDVQTLESGYTTINLLSGSAEGFALKSDTGAWNPAIAQPKNGLWYETSFTDGRVLFGGAEQNVTETLSLTLTAPDMLRLAGYMRHLDQMQADCLRFWQDEHMQYDPVFLWWWAKGAPGPQYALIYQIQISISIPTTMDASIVERDVTITLEREPYWRSVPPGANPVLWTLYKLGEQPGLNYTYDDGKLRLIGDVSPYTPPARALVSANLQNRAEYTLEAVTTDWIRFSQNHITIPAADIPGDAPALMSVAVRVDTNASEAALSKRLMIAHRTGKVQFRSKANDDNLLFVNCLPAIQANAFPATPATLAVANDTGGCTSEGGGIGAGSTTVAKRLEITPTVNLVPAVNFVSDQLNAVIQRGRFAVFMRCRQSAGTQNDISVSLRLENGVGGALTTPETFVPLQAGAGNTTRFPLMYLGTLNIPNDRAAPVSLGETYGGTGLINASNSTLSLTLSTRRTAGVGVLYIADLIFMPIDEGFVDILPTVANTFAWFLYDNTGYVLHGKPEAIVQLYGTENTSTPTEMQGAPLTLTPQVDNHLFFLYRINDDTSNVREDLAAFVNIVPRWRYIRDV
jgi:hypothetical protein